jgi:poly(A) polymerase
MHPALQRLAEATRGSPFEGELWLVGGAVRDELLSIADRTDYDLVSELDVVSLVENLFRRGLTDGPPATYARFGTAMVRMDGATLEFVTARRESYSENSRLPNVEPATLLEDARRRDFTVNTLLRNIHSGELRDPLYTGLQDLELKVLRTPLDPAATFFDDPLRMLRAVRFKWSLGFAFAPELERGLKEQAYRLEIISAERIRDELAKMLLLADADRALGDLMSLGLLDQFAPEFRAMVGLEQGKYHHLDVWDHTLLVIRQAGPGDVTLTLGCLFHDIGKPSTYAIDEEGNTRFFGHETVGAEMTREIMRRLRFSTDMIDDVVLLVKNHMRLGSSPKFSAAAARRVIRDLGDQLEPFLRLVEADVRSLKPGVKTMDMDGIRQMLADVQKVTPRSQLESPLTGREIMQIKGLSSGPEIGRLKQILQEKVLDGVLAPGDKDAAKKILAEL